MAKDENKKNPSQENENHVDAIGQQMAEQQDKSKSKSLEALVEDLNKAGLLRDPRVDALIDLINPLLKKLLSTTSLLTDGRAYKGKMEEIKNMGKPKDEAPTE